MSQKRIFILGDPGSGKNYLGQKLSVMRNIPFYDLDDIRFIRKFDIDRPKHLRKRMLKALVKKEKWVIGGVTYSWIEPALKRAQFIIILREKFLTECIRIIKRHIKRRFDKKYSKESFSGLLQLIKYDYSHFHKKDGPGIEQLKKIKKIYENKVIILKSKFEVQKYLESNSHSTNNF